MSERRNAKRDARAGQRLHAVEDHRHAREALSALMTGWALGIASPSGPRVTLRYEDPTSPGMAAYATGKLVGVHTDMVRWVSEATLEGADGTRRSYDLATVETIEIKGGLQAASKLKASW